MVGSRLDYLGRFLDCVDAVTAGRKGAISDDRRLQSDYEASFYGVLEPHLDNPDPRVRREVVALLAKLGERRALPKIREMRLHDRDTVVGACVAYLHSIDESDDAVPQLMDRLKHTNGAEFITAARKLKNIARESDIAEIRVIYGQVDGDMRAAVADVLRAVISRNPELEKKRYLILSLPVYPDEDALDSFLDKSIVYLDIRYRDNISESETVSAETYNRIVSALRKIQIRVYNEKANLRLYSQDTKDMLAETEKLLLWAAEDLSSKRIVGGASDGSHNCPVCGALMGRSVSGWTCPDCGYRSGNGGGR